MSFGQELKEFAAGMHTGVGMREQNARADYYENYGRGGRGGSNNWQDSVDQFNADNGVVPHHSMMHNLGHRLGLNTDERDSPYSTVPRTGAAATANSPVSATQQVQAVPLTGYAANAAPMALPVDDQDQDGYRRGGLVVKRYAYGGVVQPDSDAPAPENDPPPVQMASLPPVAPSAPQQAVPSPQPRPPQAGDGSAQVQASGAADDADRTLQDALHAGMMSLQQNLGLNSQNTAVGPDPQRQRGQQALMSGAGTPPPEDYATIARGIDPDNKLGRSALNLKVMESGYRHFMMNGEPEKAANYAAMIIQYSSGEAAKYGAQAADLLQKGDLKGGVQALVAGYDSIPNGKDAQIDHIDPKTGTVVVSQKDAKTGQVEAQHTLSGEDLLNAALGLKGKNMYYQTLMTAAAGAKGYTAPISESYSTAVNAIDGVQADGTLKAPAAAPAQAQGQAQAAQPDQENGLPAYMQGYSQMMSTGESRGDPTAKNGDSVGLYQIQTPEWIKATGHGPIVNGKDERLDPSMNTAVFKQITQRNEATFKQKMGRDPKPEELALMHQQGTAGGMALINAAQSSPNTPAAQVLSSLGVRDPAAHLSKNGVPANATAAQAVQSIQNYYLKGKPQSDGLMAALPEDADTTPQAPQMPSAPTPVKADTQAMQGMSPNERKAYIAQVGKKNLENQKLFGDQMQQYRAAAAAAKAGKGKDAFSLPVKDRGDALKALKDAETDMTPDTTKDPNAKTPWAQAGLSDTTVPDMRNVAYGLYAHNDLPPARALQLATSLISPVQKNFEAHRMPGGNVRLVFKSGEKLAIPANVYDQIASARGLEVAKRRAADKASQDKAARDADQAAKGRRAADAAISLGGRSVPNQGVNPLGGSYYVGP